MIRKICKLLGVAALALCLCLSLFACNWGQTAGTTEPAGTDPVSYTVQVTSQGGVALEGISLYIYEDATQQELVWYAKTDASGKVSFNTEGKTAFAVVLKDIPEGYEVEQTYEITQPETVIQLKAQLVSEDELEGKSFKLGDVMAELTVTDLNGTEYKLSQLLEEKQAVVLNFWYVSCTPCRMEFPYLQEAYEAYSDKVAVLALNHLDENVQEIADFAEELKLTMPVAQCDNIWRDVLGLNSYPTTVVIDRYGIISLFHEGALDSAQEFKDIFEHFSAEDYQQGVVTDLEEILSGEKDENEYDNPTTAAGGETIKLTVKADQVVYCDVYRVTDMYMQIRSEDAYLVYKGKTYQPQNGVIGIVVNTPDTRTPVAIGVGNSGKETQTFTVTFSPLSGTLNNPYTLSLGEFSVSIPAGNEKGVYYRYTAKEDGYLTMRCLSATYGVPYDFTLYNLNSYANRTLEADAEKDEKGNTIVKVKVKKGQVVQFSASALPDNSGSYPAVNFKFLAAMQDSKPEEEEEKEELFEYAVTLTDQNRKLVSGVAVKFAGKDVSETVKSDAQGVARVKLSQGSYTATVIIPADYQCKSPSVKLSNTEPFTAVKMDYVAVEKATYTVKVVDEKNKPIAGATVAMGDKTAVTDAKGVAVFQLPEGDYTAYIALPDGYASDSISYTFAQGKTELTVPAYKDENSDTPDPNKMDYTVLVTNNGQAVSGASVVFSSVEDGAVKAMVSTNSKGKAVANLLKGDYKVQVVGNFIENENYLSEGSPSVTVPVVAKRGDEKISIYDTYDTYKINLGSTYVENMQVGDEIYNYFFFSPTKDGFYRISSVNPDAVISYWGASEQIIWNHTDMDYTGNSFTIEVRPENIPKDESNRLVFIFALSGASDSVITVERTGDVYVSDEEAAEWIVYEGTGHKPKNITNAPALANTEYVDLTGNAAAVLGSDGYYHLNKANGPLLYVNLAAGGRYQVNFYSMMGFEQAGGTGFKATFYEGEEFIKKEDYTELMKKYTECAYANGSGTGLYPLTADLMYMLKEGGRYKGWWDESREYDYIFGEVPNLNKDIAWMFLCCYEK